MDYDGSDSRFRAEPKFAAEDLVGESGVVHDLGNLIQIAASALNVIGRSPRAGRDPALEPALTRARSALDQAGVLVRQTLGRTRGSTVLVRGTADIQDVAACLGEIHALIQWICDPDIRLCVDAAPCLPPVRCSRIELQSAVLNLAINARDAMPDGGRLGVSVRALTDDAFAPAVAIAVSDDGMGMSPETRQRAFTPYFTTKPDDLGTGLGLPMVRRFAHEAGGRVDIASTLGLGTTVTIRLPSLTNRQAFTA